MSAEVKLGDVWLDLDKRENNRRLMVVDIGDTHARCTVASDRGRPHVRHTRIRLDRFGSAFELISRLGNPEGTA